MRTIALATPVVGGFGIFGAIAASAAPASGAAIAKSVHQSDQLIRVLGCLRTRWHRSRWGRCIPGCGAGWYQPYPRAHCRPRC